MRGKFAQYGHMRYGYEPQDRVLRGDALLALLLADASGPSRVFGFDLSSGIQTVSYDAGITWHPMRCQLAEERRVLQDLRRQSVGDWARLRAMFLSDRLRRFFA